MSLLPVQQQLARLHTYLFPASAERELKYSDFLARAIDTKSMLPSMQAHTLITLRKASIGLALIFPPWIYASSTTYMKMPKKIGP